MVSIEKKLHNSFDLSIPSKISIIVNLSKPQRSRQPTPYTLPYLSLTKIQRQTCFPTYLVANNQKKQKGKVGNKQICFFSEPLTCISPSPFFSKFQNLSLGIARATSITSNADPIYLPSLQFKLRLERMIIAKQYRCIHSSTCHCTKGHVSEEVLFLMVNHLNWNPNIIATLSCVCKWFDDFAKRILWKEFCRARAPKMMCDLHSSGSHSVDGSWRALGKLLIYCSGSSKGGLFNDVQVPGHFVHRTRFSRTSGRSFLPLQCRNDDILYVSDPCEHLDQGGGGGGRDGDLGFFRGMFKSFSMSKVKKLLIKKEISFHPTEVCPYCKARLWSMLEAKMIPQSSSCRLGAYEDSIEYYVCLNGHMLGVCTLLPLSDSEEAPQ